MGLGFLLPEANSAPAKARRRYVRWSTIYGFALALGLGALFALSDDNVPQALLIAIAAFVSLAAVGVTWEFIILMRSLDELQSRIHMAALAIGFGLAAIFVVIWEMASFVGLAPGFEPLLVFPIGTIGYYVALHLVLRRYR